MAAVNEFRAGQARPQAKHSKVRERGDSEECIELSFSALSGKRVLLFEKDGRAWEGILRGLDLQTNVTLIEAQRVTVKEDGGVELGDSFQQKIFRGQAIMMIGVLTQSIASMPEEELSALRLKPVPRMVH